LSCLPLLYYSFETLTHYKINLKHTRQGDRRNNDDKGKKGKEETGMRNDAGMGKDNDSSDQTI
jgi:hypothetical protein